MEQPNYQIGDRLYKSSNIYVRGIAKISDGSNRYFLQIGDNTLIATDEDLDEMEFIAEMIDGELTA